MIRMAPQEAAYFALSNTHYGRDADPVTPQDLVRTKDACTSVMISPSIISFSAIADRCSYRFDS